MTPAEELRQAVLAVREGGEPIPGNVAGPLTDLLESIAAEAERHAAKGWGNDQSEIADGRYVAIARAINGGGA